MRFQFLNIFANTCVLSVFFTIAILLDMKWYLLAILISISSVPNDVENFFLYLLVICIYIFFRILSVHILCLLRLSFYYY